MSALSLAADLASAATTGHPFTQKPKKPAKKLQNTGSCTGTTSIDYCTEFASIKCTQSSHFLKLTILPGMNRPTFGPQKHHGATVTDCIPEINYPLFCAPWNLCFSLLNPLVLAATTAKFAATGTWTTVPIPCCLGHVPLGNWGKSVGDMKVKFVPHFTLGFGIGTTIHNLRVSFLSNPEVDCLTKNCTLTCAWLGTITIASSGRDEKNPAPYGPIDGLAGPGPFDFLRNACGIIMNYVGLGAMVGLAALDSLFAGLQKGFETGDPMEGLFAGLKTAAGYAIGFAIAGGVGKGGGAFLAKTKIGRNLSSKVTAKFSAFAQSNFSKGLSKLHVKGNEALISMGRSLQRNSVEGKYSTYAQGVFIEWLGKRNLEKVLRGRNEVLAKANTVNLNIIESGKNLERQFGENIQNNAAERALIEILERKKQDNKKAADELAERISNIKSDRTAKQKSDAALGERYDGLKRSQDADMARRSDLETRMGDTARERNSLANQRENMAKDRDELVGIRNEMNDKEAYPGLPEYVDKQIADRNSKIDDMDQQIGALDRDFDSMGREHTDLDASIRERGQEMDDISKTRDDLHSSMDDDSSKIFNDRENRDHALDHYDSANKKIDEMNDSIARRNNENERLEQEWADGYDTRAQASYNKEMNDNEIAANNGMYDNYGLKAPEEKPGPTGWRKDTADAINDGNAVNAKGAVNWTTDNATKATGNENWTYQGAIDGAGSSDAPESIGYEFSEVDGNTSICSNGSHGLQTD